MRKQLVTLFGVDRVLVVSIPEEKNICGINLQAAIMYVQAKINDVFLWNSALGWHHIVTCQIWRCQPHCSGQEKERIYINLFYKITQISEIRYRHLLQWEVFVLHCSKSICYKEHFTPILLTLQCGLSSPIHVYQWQNTGSAHTLANNVTSGVSNKRYIKW